MTPIDPEALQVAFPTRARSTAFPARPTTWTSEDEKAMARAVTERASCNLVHLATGVKTDLFVKGVSAFDVEEFERRVTVRLGDESPREVFVKSAEDTLLRKLLWYRLGGEMSDRQWEDVRGIVSVQASRLDVEYLIRWADRLGIRDLLDRLLSNR